MFDFASSMRQEGDTNNQNDKGLVTRDRKTRKDAFYFYKANWNKKENTVHLCSKEYTEREEDTTDVIVFTSAPSAKLYINGKLIGNGKTDSYATVRWDNVRLAKGENRVVVKTALGEDSATWVVK
jgi:beta-galactosidase